MGSYEDFWGNRERQQNTGIKDEFRRVLRGVDIRKQKPPMERWDNTLITFRARNNEFFCMDNTMLSKHLLILGGVGTGKSNVFYHIVEQYMSQLNANDVLLVFDTKGDFYQRFFDANNPQHILIGNSAEYRQRSCYWNIYDELKDRNGQFTRESEILAKEISKSLFSGMQSEMQPFFAIAAADLVAKTMIYQMRRYNSRLRSSNPLPEPNTGNLVKFLKSASAETFRRMLCDQSCPDFLSALSYIGETENTTPQALGVLGYINAMVDDLFVGIFSGPDGSQGKSFSMREIIRRRRKTVVFMEDDLEVGRILAPMYSTLFDLALKEALGNQHNQRTNSGNVFLVIDEFKLLPRMEHIDDALNFGRSFGVKVCAGLQSIHQLYDNYGESRGKVLAAGFMNSICFQTWDLDSRRFISDRFGETYETQTIEGNEVQREGHVVSDWDILALRTGEAFINLTADPPIPPFRFYFLPYKYGQER